MAPASGVRRSDFHSHCSLMKYSQKNVVPKRILIIPLVEVKQ